MVRKKKVQAKEAEYPNIKWDNLEDETVQKATIIYNDRINTYRKMVQLDAEIDSSPTSKIIIDFVQASIRNKQCFRELDHLNRKGILLMRHPLLQNYSLQQKLKSLLRNNPDKFLSDYTLEKNNISRYQSYLNNLQKGTKQQREGWKECLLEHTEKATLMTTILKETQ